MKKYELVPTIDLNDCFLWQYDLASNLQQLMFNKQAFNSVNVSQFWNNFITNVFNIDTANTFGLELWGIVLGIKRPSYIDNGQTIIFSDDQYRVVIKGQLLLMNSNGSCHDINTYLEWLFSEPIFVQDYFNMSITIVVFHTPTPEELAVLNMDGFLPRPSGVLVNLEVVSQTEVFGFYGQELSTFDNGAFLS